MQKVLFVTGKKAYPVLKKQLDKTEKHDETHLHKLPIEVAAFTTPELISREIDTERYNWIVVSGMSPHDYTDMENVVKGPRNAYDTTELDLHKLDQLSPKKPADQVIDIGGIDKEKLKNAIDRTKPTTTIRGIPVGGDTPIKIISEIVDATKLDKQQLAREARRRMEEGADIIDIGVHHNATPNKIKETIETTRKIGPTSIDTMNPEHIETAINTDVDLILSLNTKLLEQLKNKIEGENIVVLGSHDPSQIHRDIKKARSYGANPIADPILDPPGHGLTESLNRYRLFREKDRETPLLMGVGNATELIDTDSHGVNAILTTLASELQVNLLLTTEASLKTQGSTAELKKASMMAFTAKIRDTTPKDLGIDLIKHKDKKRKEFKPQKASNTIEPDENELRQEKPSGGCYEVGVDREENKIYTTHYNCETKKPTQTVIGTNSTTIINYITQKQEITPSHAAYLSKELYKAQIALKTGKNYIQDTPLYKIEE